MAGYLRGLSTNFLIRNEIHLGAIRAGINCRPNFVSLDEPLGMFFFLW